MHADPGAAHTVGCMAMEHRTRTYMHTTVLVIMVTGKYIVPERLSNVPSMAAYAPQ
jgi:hypothetical protein